MAIAQKLAGYSLGAADLLRRAMGKKKKEILDKEYVPFSDGMKANGYSDGAIKTLWDILVPFSDYAFNKAHTAGYGLVSLLDRLPQGQLPGRVHGGAAHLASATTRTRPRSTSPSAGAWASRCCRPTSTTPTATSPRAAPTSASACRRSATSAPTSSTSIVRDPQGQGRVRRLLRLPAQGRRGRLQQEDRRVADQGRRVRLARAHAARACSRSTPRRSTRSWTPSATRRSASSTCSAAVDDDGAGDGGDRSTSPIPIGEWDKTDLLAFEREMLGLYVSDHPLLGVEHVLAGAVDMSVAGARRARRRHAPSRSAASCPASPARSPSRATPWALGARWRTSTARSRCCSSRRPTSARAVTSPRTPSCSSRAGSTGARTSRSSSRWR